MFDSETGEEIKLTKSRWNNKEGRVNLDFHGVIGTGTGKIDISSIITEEDNNNNNNNYYYSRGNSRKNINNNNFNNNNNDNNNIHDNNNQSDNNLHNNTTHHPLILKFLEDGPLNPYIHTRWNPKTGKIDPKKSKKSMKNENNIKKVTSNIIQDDIEEESLIDEVVVDPLAFFHRKKKLGGVVDLAIQQKTVLSSADSSAFNTEDSNIVSLPQILVAKNSKNERVDSPSQSSKHSSTKINTDQNICNQIFAIVNNMDDISHPKPSNYNLMSRDEKKAYKRAENERKFILLKQCEEIAAIKGRMSRELRQAIQDEELKEKRRMEAIKDLKNPDSKFAKEMRKRHREERERAKVYIRTLQYDNEVLFLTKLHEYNLIW